MGDKTCFDKEVLRGMSLPVIQRSTTEGQLDEIPAKIHKKVAHDPERYCNALSTFVYSQ